MRGPIGTSVPSDSRRAPGPYRRGASAEPTNLHHNQKKPNFRKNEWNRQGEEQQPPRQFPGNPTNESDIDEHHDDDRRSTPKNPTFDEQEDKPTRVKGNRNL
jgi:hypothetical protein